MISQRLESSAAEGITLEAVLESNGHPLRLAVVCHAHPRMGGTMDSPLLLAVRDELVLRNWAVLRFNFRGVGSSTGDFGLGLDEVADVTAAIEEGTRILPGLPVALIGWSFGGAVAIRAAVGAADVTSCAVIAPAVAERPGLTAGLPPARDLKLEIPLLVIVGSNDDQVSPRECREWAAVAGAKFVEVPGANHLFWAKYETVAATTADWLDSVAE